MTRIKATVAKHWRLVVPADVIAVAATLGGGVVGDPATACAEPGPATSIPEPRRDSDLHPRSRRPELIRAST
jgi:hypothetical protein